MIKCYDHQAKLIKQMNENHYFCNTILKFINPGISYINSTILCQEENC
jgi:hypothetical protein